MTKKEAVKKYGIIKQSPVNLDERCATKFTDRRNLDHPYCKDRSHYNELEFFLMLTAFESPDFMEYGCYGYESKRMNFEEAITAYEEISRDWNRPGRKAWNSVSLIGVDEEGNCFSVV